MWPSGFFGVMGLCVCVCSALNRSGLLNDYLAIHGHPVAGKCADERRLKGHFRHFPENTGGRFSMKCATPSRKSALAKLFIISTLATSVASASVWNSDS
jgi:hypothetical protein